MFLCNKYLGIELGGTKHSYKSIILRFPALNKENKEISIIDREIRTTGETMDQTAIKTSNPKCRLYWCLINFIDWTYSQSCWYFRPALWSIAPLNFSLGSSPPPLPCVNKYTVVYSTVPTYIAVGFLETNCQRRTRQRPFIHYIQLLAAALWKKVCSQWRRKIFTVYFCGPQRYETLAILATVQWMLRDFCNCVMMPVANLRPVCIHHVFSIPTHSLSSLCVACIIVHYIYAYR